MGPGAESLEGARVYNDDVIRPLDNAIYKEGALAVLKGNLAPDGCVIKPSACEPRLLKHTGPALVFDDYPALKAAIDRDDLDVTADHVLVLRNAGPQGGPGHARVGHAADPDQAREAGRARHGAHLRRAHVRHQLWRLHPACGAGGLRRRAAGAGRDRRHRITVDVPARTIHMQVSEAELARRRAALPPQQPRYERGYGWMFSRHIKQANEGCDFDFLETGFGKPVGEPSIY